jgi:chromosome partitioning protein
MTPIYVFTNNKGGVGKSTSATNVAYGLVQTLRYGGIKHPRVLLVDTDGQAHATLLTTGRNDFGEKDSLHTVLMAQREDMLPTIQQCLVQSHWDEGLHVLPGSAWLDETENLLFSANGAPYRLAQALAPIAHSYNAIVIDTRPSYTLMTKMAILAGTDAIIPIEPRYLESIALNEAIREIIDIRDGWGYNNINVGGILLTKVDKRIKGHKDAVIELKANASVGHLMCGVIPANEEISYSHSHHMSVMQYNPKAKASQAYAGLSIRLARQAFGKGGSHAS